MTNMNWDCPHCGRAVTISSERYSEDWHTLKIKNSVHRCTLTSTFFVCPNADCQKYTLTARLATSSRLADGNERDLNMVRQWKLIPESDSKQFPSYIPAVVLQDYREACSIRDLSPKASATLSRRCLQGMLRDFWQVKPANLAVEIDAIKNSVDQITWDAIDGLRKMGNIGAHMEKDINLIVDVDPEEAQLLISLIETLLTEWYVHREERSLRMNSLIAAAAAKKP